MSVAATIAILASVAVANEPPSACSLDSPIDELLQLVGVAVDEATLMANGNCEKVASAAEEEACLCAAFRLGWHGAARSGLRQRLLRRQPATAMRKLAQAAVDATQVILARLHPKYPQHLKFVPALEFAQSEELISVRVRYARYPRGEPLFVGTEGMELRLSDAELYYAVEGAEHPGYIETTLRWRHLLRRRDDCRDTEAQCEKWADEGACNAEAPVTFQAAGGAADGEPADCADWAAAGECTKNPGFMRAQCKTTCEQADAAAPKLVRVRCPHACGQCATPANGMNTLEATWAQVPGGLVFEARKAMARNWDRLLGPAQPFNRIGDAPSTPPVGTLLKCVEGCVAEAHECRQDCQRQAAQLYMIS